MFGAVNLFVDSVRRVDAGFALSAENRAAVYEICRLVQGLPLAIVLAASWAEMLTPAEIVSHMRGDVGQRLDLLESELHDLPQHQRSIRAVFDSSWQLLNQRTQAIFCQLAIFAAPFTVEAAKLVANASLRDLMNLVNRSLINRVEATQGDTGRFGLHELLRQYALEKLAQSPQSEAVHRRHAQHFLAIPTAGVHQIKGAQQQAAMTQLENDIADIRAAWSWAVAQQQTGLLVDAVDGLCQFYEWHGRYEEGEAAIAEALGCVDGVDSAEFLTWQAIFNRNLNNPELARQQLAASLSLLADPSMPTQLAQKAFAQLQIGQLLRESDREAAHDHFTQSLANYRATDDQWGEANALEAMGWLVQHWGNYAEARQLYEDSLTLRQALGDQRGIARSQRTLGGIVLYQGDHAYAERLVRLSIRVQQQLDDRVGLADSLSKLGEVLLFFGRFSEAIAAFQQGKAIYESLGLPIHSSFIDAMHSLALLHLGQTADSQALAHNSLNLFRQLGTQRGIAYAQLALGWTMLLDDDEAAEQSLQASLHIYRELGQPDELAQALALLGLLAWRRGDEEAAQTYLDEARRTAEEMGAFTPQMVIRPIASLLVVESIVEDSPFVTESEWFRTALNSE